MDNQDFKNKTPGLYVYNLINKQNQLVLEDISSAIEGMVKIHKIYRSNKQNLDYYQDKYEKYKKLYKTLREINREGS